MNASTPRLLDLLRDTASGGAPMALILDSWAEVEDAVLADSFQAREALTEAARALPPIAGTLAERRALATAVMTPRGGLCFADAAFQALFPESADLRPLLKRALRDGPVVSLAEGAAGAAFMAWVGDASAARRWPLDPEAATALQAGPERLAVVVSAPSRSSELARRAARVLDLTALEARLAEALLFAPNLEVAAADAGVGRETARDALRRLNAKLGVRRTPELVARLIGVMCAAQGPREGDEIIAETAFGLTPAEARAAALVAQGATAPEAAQALGISAETVRTHVKAVLAKTGARGVKDLARLFAEARELVALADAAEPVFGEEEGGGRLRILPSLDGARRVALIDYGPYDAEPVLVFHGGAAGRRLPEQLRASLIARGLRPIVIQRPGFGLSDPAVTDAAAAGAADMAAVAERLRLKRVRVLARDTGAPTAMAFAVAYPELLGRSVLLNPHPPMSRSGERTSFLASVQRRLLRNPDLAVAFAEFLRRQVTTELLERIFERSMGEVAADRAALADPAVRRFLVRDIQAMSARSIWGFAAEQAIYAGGWEPPSGLRMEGWSLAVSSELAADGDFGWTPISGPPTMIEGAGLLAQFTHPDALAALMA
jgi:DNA-binding CsgD family transcriptional regulator/pimeloyl-ACP methyl ester carboxylesterase